MTANSKSPAPDLASLTRTLAAQVIAWTALAAMASVILRVLVQGAA